MDQSWKSNHGAKENASSNDVNQVRSPHKPMTLNSKVSTDPRATGSSEGESLSVSTHQSASGENNQESPAGWLSQSKLPNVSGEFWWMFSVKQAQEGPNGPFTARTPGRRGTCAFHGPGTGLCVAWHRGLSHCSVLISSYVKIQAG